MIYTPATAPFRFTFTPAIVRTPATVLWSDTAPDDDEVADLLAEWADDVVAYDGPDLAEWCGDDPLPVALGVGSTVTRRGWRVTVQRVATGAARATLYRGADDVD